MCGKCCAELKKFPVPIMIGNMTAQSQPIAEPALAQSADAFARFARFYDADYRHYDADLEVLAELAKEWGDPILELGCGTGRLLLPLAAAGHSITGVDISPALLQVASNKLAGAKQAKRITLHQADLRTFDLPNKSFTFAFCTSNTLMHLPTPTDQLAALRNAQRHLRKGGLLFVDLFNPDLVRLMQINGVQELADQWTDVETGALVIKWCVRTVDWAEQLQETLFIYEELLPDGQTRRTACPFTLRFLWRSEAELLLEQAGFTVQEIWGDFDGTPYAMHSDHLILLAQKI